MEEGCSFDGLGIAGFNLEFRFNEQIRNHLGKKVLLYFDNRLSQLGVCETCETPNVKESE